MRRLGIVDIGSNTVRLVVFERQASGGFRLLDDVRERVRLGAGVSRGGLIRDDTMKRALALLRRFADYGRGAGLDDLEVIGTSALRDAANGGKLVRAARAFGLDVHVLAGKDEARLGVLAVANGFDLDDAWVMDLGGGSAQVSRMAGRLWHSGRAYPLGAVRLTEAFLDDDPPRKAQVAALEAAVADSLSKVARKLAETPGPVVVMGGAVRNLARAVQQRTDYPLDLLHGYWLLRDDLEALTDELLAVDSKRRIRIPGIHPDRADVIIAAAVVFRWLLRASRRDGLLVSGDGVREGALYRHVLRPPHLVADVGRSAVEGLLEHYVADTGHARQVQRLARSLFEQLAPLHRLEPRAGDLLDAAALLHEAGLAVHFYRFQRHGAFLLGAAALDGFTHREQAIIRLLVRRHRKGRLRLGRWRQILAGDDRRRLLLLLACLRMAVALDRTRGARVPDVVVTIKPRTVRLEVPVVGDDSVELWDLGAQLALAEKAFKRRFKAIPVAGGHAAAADQRSRPAYDQVHRR